MFGIQERRIATSCLHWIGAHVASVARDIPRSRKPRELLPTGTPLRLLEADGQAVRPCDLDLPGDDVLLALHRKMVLARRFDTQADRKSTRLNSSHPSISYAVFCLKKKT